MYRGVTVEIPAGRGSLNGTKNRQNMPITDLVQAENVVVDSGMWRKSPGISKLFDNYIGGAPSFLAAYDWWPSSSIQRTVSYWTDGSLRKEVGGDVDAYTLKSGLSGSGFGIFVEGGAEEAGRDKKLFFFNGEDMPQVLTGDGTTTADISKPSSDWSSGNFPRGGVIHQGRLIVWGSDANPHAIYVSTLADHEDFQDLDDSYIYTIYSGVGERIVNCLSVDNRLYIFKYPNGIYWLDMTDPDLAYIGQVSVSLGSCGPASVAGAGGEVVFLSAMGSICLLSPLLQGGGIADADLMAKFGLEDFTRDVLNPARFNKARLVYLEERKKLYISVVTKESSEPDAMFVLDAKDGPKVFWDTRGKCRGIFSRKDQNGLSRLCGGESGGYLYLLDAEDRSVDGSAFEGKFETPPTDYGWFAPEIAGRDKRFDWLEMTTFPTGNYNVSVDHYVDGQFVETVYVNMGEEGGAFGSFTFGTDRFGSSYVQSHKAKIHGRGQRNSFVVRNNGLNQDFAISGMKVSFVPQRTRGTR